MSTRDHEERKLVTVLFADVVGSTGLSAQIDAEALREKMRQFFGIAREEIERFGGTVEKFIGDAVMAVFGLPLTSEDDAVHAVRAAVAIHTRVRPLVQSGTIPEIRIGIHTGEAVANPKAAEKGDFLVTGEVVNLAARLQQHANPGQILVGEATHLATRWAFEYRPIPPLRVKGRQDRIPAFECAGIRLEPLERRGMPGVRSPLVGRDEEMAGLQQVFDRLQSGSGAIVMLIGEPGIGKSRLAAEMRRRVAEENVNWLLGRALSISSAISYWPFLEIIRSACGINEADTQEQSWAKLESRVAGLLPDQVAEIAPYLGTLLALDIKEVWRNRVRFLDGKAMGRQIYRSTRLFFARLAQERPLVLLFEDLHWIDGSSAELLEHLFPLSSEVPVLFFGLSRPIRETPAARLREAVVSTHPDRYTELTLQPLSSAHSTILVTSLLQRDELPGAVRQLILDKSEGNPFFVEELTRALIDLGAIVRDASGRWQVSSQIDRISIPDTLRGVLIARIDRLDEDVRQVLKTASVIGRSFFYRVLGAIADLGAELDRHLDELQWLELIRERRRLPELEYTFKHALTQEAAYETLLARVRKELHRKVARAIEELFPDRLDEFFGLLAYHYASADEWERAQHFLFKAGDQSVRMAADAEALEYYRQASTAYARVFGDRWDPLQRAVLERKIGEALYRRGDHQQAGQYLQRALSYIGSPYPASRWGIRIAILGQLMQQIGHRLLPGLFLGRPPARQQQLRAEERARIYEALGWIDYFVSVERLTLDALLLLNVSERHGFDYGISRGSMGLGLICDLIPLFRIARYYHTRSVAVAEQIQHPLAQGLAYLGLGLHTVHAGPNGGQARDLFRRSATIYRQAGELRQWGAAAGLVSWVSRLGGELSISFETTREMVQVGQETSDRQLWGWGLCELGTALWQSGAVDEAVPNLREALELLKSVPDDRWVIYTQGALGRCYLRQGRFDEAVGVLNEALALAASRQFTGFLGAQPRGALTEAYLSAAEHTQGGEREAWLTKAGRVCRDMRTQGGIDSEVLPEAFRHQGTLEWLSGEQQRAERWWQRSLRSADQLGLRYDLGLTHLEIGRRTRRTAHVEQAASIFAEIGAKRDLIEARVLLHHTT